MSESIIIAGDERVVRIRLNRPEVRNALDAQVIAELTAAFRTFDDKPNVRVIVLEGEGAIFCGGADINYMRAALDMSQAQNIEDALRLSDMFAAIDNCPVPTIAKVQGAALGGGAGLIAVCDIVLAEEDALFGFTEAKLGIVPAVISPFVLRKIGQSHARALFPTAERFSADRAMRIGLVHEVVPPGQLDASVESKIQELLTSGPSAARLGKEIARTVDSLTPYEARRWTAERIAGQRVSPEGQEGLRAFLDKRRPSWR
ncbi:MAG TPA: enoyl-CoA hydratase-related protein [Candidatus Eremiobacteraceae bacterium]|jgi:methylglutaconyl-CoA hydratase|nr:enoyl-CoA hydratase-related protein [Candidatus Eremiobacteraceae bacterium]